MSQICVLYDDRGLRLKFGGIPRCFAESISRLPGDIKWMLAAKSTMNEYFNKPPFSLPFVRKEITRKSFCEKYLRGHYIRGLDRCFGLIRKLAPGVLRADFEINNKYFEQCSQRADVDVIHLTEPHYFNYGWERLVGRKPLVITVHDLIPDELWWSDDLREDRRRVLERSDRIIAVSEYTKQQIVGKYAIDPSKVKVIHHGAMAMQKSGKAPFSGVKYILYVGMRNDYKNFNVFLKGVAPVLLADRDLHLVCTGKPFDAAEAELITRLGIFDRVLNKYIPDEQMYKLYHDAAAFVYPSLMEGFGIPILDAFSAECPVVLSNCTCFPEVAGGAAQYFDGTSPESLTDALRHVLNDAEYANHLRQLGSERVKMFSWESTVQKLAQVYREVAR